MKFKNIPLTDIAPDPDQPRKFFDPAKLQELSADVKANEVHTPITIRPIPGTQLYKLVLGERRFKASELAGKKTIPAIVRELSDQEALNLQLSENLNRENVHPLEEGLAFARLLTPDTTLQQIADRFGRSVAFIHKRAQLAKLVTEAQDLFFSGKIALDDSMALSRLDSDEQTAILKNCNGNYSNLKWMCREAVTDLDKALFKLGDAKLYPEAGACTKCPYNTANSPTLFDDIKGKNCTRNSCFTIKTQRAYKAMIQKEVIDGGKIPVIWDSYLSTEEKVFDEIAKSMGVFPLERNRFTKVYEPTPPDPIEPFAQWCETMDYDLLNPAEEKAARDAYEEEKRDNEKDAKEYLQEIEEYNSNGPDRKEAFIIAGQSMGKTIQIKLSAAMVKASINGTSDGDHGTDMIIADLLEKEESAKEKERQTFLKELRDIASRGSLPEDQMPLPTEYYSIDDWLNGQRSDSIVNALAVHASLNWKTVEKVNVLLTGDDEPATDELYNAIVMNPENALNICLRNLVAQIILTSYSDHDSMSAKAFEVWMMAFMPSVYNQTRDFHKAINDERKERLEKRIEGIRKKAAKALEAIA